MPTRVHSVAEAPVIVELNGARWFRTTATPTELRDLVVGRLAAEGFIDGAAGVLELAADAPHDGCYRLRVRIDAASERAGRAVLRDLEENGAGVLGLTRAHGAFPPRAPGRDDIDPATVLPLLRALTAAEEAMAGGGGGVHGSAVVIGGQLGPPRFDVGRHGAVDKAIGAALHAGARPAECGLITTARISGEMAAKAARAGFAWLGGRSVATTLALAVAAAAGLPVITRGASTTPMLHVPGGSR